MKNIGDDSAAVEGIPLRDAVGNEPPDGDGDVAQSIIPSRVDAVSVALLLRYGKLGSSGILRRDLKSLPQHCSNGINANASVTWLLLFSFITRRVETSKKGDWFAIISYVWTSGWSGRLNFWKLLLLCTFLEALIHRSNWLNFSLHHDRLFGLLNLVELNLRNFSPDISSN